METVTPVYTLGGMGTSKKCYLELLKVTFEYGRTPEHHDSSKSRHQLSSAYLAVAPHGPELADCASVSLDLSSQLALRCCVIS